MALLGAWATIYFFEDEVKKYALRQIDSSLATGMDIQDARLNLWTKFPLASIELQNIWLEDAATTGDTLLIAEKAFLSFNPWSFIQGEYSVKRIDLENGKLRIFQSEKGDNFHFWKSKEDSLSGNFQFDLNSVQLHHVSVDYVNSSSQVEIQAFAEDLKMKGAFSGDSSLIDWSGELVSYQSQLNKLTGLTNERLQTSGALKIMDAGKRIELKDAEIAFDGGRLYYHGEILISDRVKLLADVKVSELKISAVKRLFPELLGDVLSSYDIDAVVDLSGAINGAVSDGELPSIALRTNIKDASLTHKASSEQLYDINSTGQFKLLGNAGWEFGADNVEAVFRNGFFSAKGMVADKGIPEIDAELSGSSSLQELKNFLALDALEIFEGDLNLNAKWRGKLPDWELDLESIRSTDLSGSANVEDARIKLINDPHLFEALEASLILDDNDIIVRKLEGIMGESDFAMEGFFRNSLAFLSDDSEELNLEVSYRAELLRLEDLFITSDRGEDSGADSGSFRFPERVNANLKLEIEELSHREFHSSEIQGVANLKNGRLMVNPLSLKTAEGELLTLIEIRPENTDGQYILEAKGSLSNMDISEIFRSFEDFGQEVITHRHLKGLANADYQCVIPLNDDLSIDMAELNSVVQVTIEEGELIGLESLSGISDYLRNNRLISGFVEVDEFDRKLRHVRFSTLSNDIEVRNGLVYIPKMEISSSAMDISASGSHSFSNEIDYSIAFRIRDVLKKKKSSFGETEDDGLGSRFFLAMTGTTDNPSFAFDRDARRAQRKEDFEKEKKVFKEIIKEEFGGLFGKKKEENEEGAKEKMKEEDTEIIIEWSESDTTKNKDKEKKEKKSFWDRLKDDKDEEWVPDPEDDEDDF